MKKILTIVESVCSLSLLGAYIMLLMLRNTISYEKVSTFEETPKSSLFVIMEHNHILGYLFVFLGVMLAFVTAIRLFYIGKENMTK